MRSFDKYCKCLCVEAKRAVDDGIALAAKLVDPLRKRTRQMAKKSKKKAKATNGSSSSTLSAMAAHEQSGLDAEDSDHTPALTVIDENGGLQRRVLNAVFNRRLADGKVLVVVVWSSILFKCLSAVFCNLQMLHIVIDDISLALPQNTEHWVDRGSSIGMSHCILRCLRSAEWTEL